MKIVFKIARNKMKKPFTSSVVMCIAVSVFFMLILGCPFITQPVEDINDLTTVQDTFRYETTRMVQVNLDFSTNLDILVNIYSAADLNEGSFSDDTNPVVLDDLPKLATVVLDANGAFSGSLSVPLIYSQLVINPLYPGFPENIIIDIEKEGSIETAECIFSSTRPGKRSVLTANERMIDTYYTYNGFTYYSEYSLEGLPDAVHTSDMDAAERELLVDHVTASLPEYRENTDKLTDSVISLTKDADVSVTFLHEGAGFYNSFGVIAYDPENSEFSGTLPAEPPDPDEDLDADGFPDLKIIFPNASFKYSGGSMYTGDTLDLGSFPSGQTLIWTLIANGFKSGINGVSDEKVRFYSKREWNPEDNTDYNQHVVLLLENYDTEEDSATFVLGFEDLKRPYGDNDFNDLVILVEITPASAIAGIDDEETFERTVQLLPDDDGDGITDPYDVYPSNGKLAAETAYHGYIAFEDQWPAKGDYDFNDLVASYSYNLRTDANNYIGSV
jgi:hypothetical protein